MKKLNTIPANDGFRMPAEFEPQKKIWMIWPERPDNWRLGGKPAQEVFTKVANTIGKYEPMTVVVSRNQYSNARNMLADYVKVVEMSNDDSWIRDCGATFVINDKGEMRGVDWVFNAWGGLVDGLYFPWDQDDKIAQKMCELEQVDSYRLEDFVLEGGSIHVDGEGTVMVTEECLLSEGRNPHMTKEQIGEKIKNMLKEGRLRSLMESRGFKSEGLRLADKIAYTKNSLKSSLESIKNFNPARAPLFSINLQKQYIKDLKNDVENYLKANNIAMDSAEFKEIQSMLDDLLDDFDL